MMRQAPYLVALFAVHKQVLIGFSARLIRQLFLWQLHVPLDGLLVIWNNIK